MFFNQLTLDITRRAGVENHSRHKIA